MPTLGIARSPWGSGVGILFVGGAIAATVAAGTYLRARESWMQADQPSRVFPTTHAAMKFVSAGSGAPPVANLKDTMGEPLPLRGVAMWAKLSIPNGIKNHPHVEFKLRDDQGTDFPFNVAWIPDGAYLLLPRGYPAPPKHLTAYLLQGDQVAGQAELPSLPPAVSSSQPATSPPWPGLSIARCPTGPEFAANVSLLIRAHIAPGNSLIARTHGSSSCDTEPSDGYLYMVRPPGQNSDAIVDAKLNFPQTTKTLYLELRESKLSASNGAALGSPKSRGSSYDEEVVRSAVFAVPIGKTAPMEITWYRHAGIISAKKSHVLPLSTRALQAIRIPGH